MAPLLVYVLSLLVAIGIGAATHRASLCTVKAVTEIITSRRACMLVSFLKASLWALAVSLPLALWHGGTPLPAHPLAFAACLGGLLFGFGAAVNGGCSFSTLAYLAEGRLSYIATIAGVTTSVAVLGEEPPVTRAWRIPPVAGTVVVGLAGVFLLFEVRRLWRSRRTAVGPRLSVSALILGLGGGALIALHGGWSYTSSLRRSVLPTGMPGKADAAFFLALLAGMILSARRRGTLALRTEPRSTWGRRFVGGLIMGAGAGLVPGGNSMLLLGAIPTFSPHAIPAYAAMLVGAAIPVLLYAGRPKVVCDGDVLRVEAL